MKSNYAVCLVSIFLIINFQSCLPSSTPYPNAAPATVVSRAQVISDSLEAYIIKWSNGQASPNIPANLIPKGVSDCKNFYLKNPDSVTAAETWAIRYAKPINKDSLYGGIPDPKITYLVLGPSLAPFGSKMVIEGEFPHCRFFSLQITPPLNGKEYYAQRQFGTAEISVTDSDIDPLPGNANPFRVGANRNTVNRKYRYEFDLTTGDPTTLNNGGHTYPYLRNGNNRKAALITYQGPLGFKSVLNTPLDPELQGDWDLGTLWVRMYEPDDNAGALGGVPLPKLYYKLPNGKKYFIGCDFSKLKRRGDTTVANRLTNVPTNINTGASVGWYKSWGITRSMLNGVCQSNGWNRIDSGTRVRTIDLGWTGRGEFQPAPGNIEPHATTNNYATYFGREVIVPRGMVAVLTGKLPTFPSTRNGESKMTAAQVRYWSIVGIDADITSPLPATTIHAISDDDVKIDADRNYVICYSNKLDKPNNATAANGVSWVDFGKQVNLGLLMRWVCIAPNWRFEYAPQEHNLDFAHSDWASTQYDSTLIGVNWRNGFMKCFLPRIHYMTIAEFEAIGSNVTAENVPVWVDSSAAKAGAAESQKGTVTASSVLDNTTANKAANLIDADITTAWSSAFGVVNQTVTIDLNAVKKISAIKLNWDFILFAKDYTIKVSADNTNYTTIATAVNQNGQIDLYKNLKNITGRYVKLELTKMNIFYYRLLEFEVYTTDCNCTSLPISNPPNTTGTQLSIYPNPVNSTLYYKVTGLTSNNSLSVFDMKGRLIKKVISISDTGSIDVRALPVGMYAIVLFDDKRKVVTNRFVKQ